MARKDTKVKERFANWLDSCDAITNGEAFVVDTYTLEHLSAELEKWKRRALKAEIQARRACKIVDRYLKEKREAGI